MHDAAIYHILEENLLSSFPEYLLILFVKLRFLKRHFYLDHSVKYVSLSLQENTFFSHLEYELTVR